MNRLVTAPQQLNDLLQVELCAIPLDRWGFFFPCHVAVWRFVQRIRPDLLGDLAAGFDAQPYFRGRGAEWFCSTLGNNPTYLNALEALMYPLSAGLPESARLRGFVTPGELPSLPQPAVSALLAAIVSTLPEAQDA